MLTLFIISQLLSSCFYVWGEWDGEYPPSKAAGRVVRAVSSLWLLAWSRLWLLLLLINSLPGCKSQLLLTTLTTHLTSSLTPLLLTKAAGKAPSVKGAVLAQ